MKTYFKNMPELEPPQELHEKIMRRVFFIKFRLVIFSIIAVIAAGFLASGWYIWNEINETETLPVLSAIVQDFEWNSFYISYFIEEITNLISLTVALILTLNVSLAGYLFYKFTSFRKAGYQS